MLAWKQFSPSVMMKKAGDASANAAHTLLTLRLALLHWLSTRLRELRYRC